MNQTLALPHFEKVFYESTTDILYVGTTKYYTNPDFLLHQAYVQNKPLPTTTPVSSPLPSETREFVIRFEETPFESPRVKESEAPHVEANVKPKKSRKRKHEENVDEIGVRESQKMKAEINMKLSRKIKLTGKYQTFSHEFPHETEPLLIRYIIHRYKPLVHAGDLMSAFGVLRNNVNRELKQATKRIPNLKVYVLGVGNSHHLPLNTIVGWYNTKRLTTQLNHLEFFNALSNFMNSFEYGGQHGCQQD
jgi:hypothetical protein